ncbi:MAG TPA: DUF4956 domain-containing protein [Pyrinomonadaceae bacterium]|jgi:uncharacterized membrane protein YhiD involved in acid resistance
MTNGKTRGKGFTVAVAVGALAVGFLLVAALMRGYGSGSPGAGVGGAADPARAGAEEQAGREGQQQAAQQAAQPGRTAEPTPRATRTPDDDGSRFSQVFGGGPEPSQPTQPAPGQKGDWLMTFATVTVRLTLAALLSAMLAFRPRRLSRSVKRNPFVAQTQILLAVVASALMMIVGDSTARAFGIFATVSLVRFRTNIKDPKEITVLLLALAIGLATGVGRWELGLILTLFVLVLLWGLEYREQEQITRAMELTVKTSNIGTTQDALLRLFKKYDFSAEMRTIDRPDGEGETGCIVYYVDVGQQASTDRLSEELLAADPKNIDSVEWDQQKNTSYFYQ